ncbi:MAG: imidazole glycerol phosphate synthase subunit HisH, partial [Desulfobacterales bacterium]|nr:imidazole glycerol phosphate synthase subunit HisH [Desulfobacterales bacterium]
AIIDYDAGNLASVQRAVSHLGVECVITKEEAAIKAAERIIFPGVGAAGAAMQSLQRYSLDRVIKEELARGKPVLGICIGSQIVLTHSEENDTPCLGIIEGSVRSFATDFQTEGQKLKVPHMGWNGVDIKQAHPLLSGVSADDEFYFVHSYYPQPQNPDCVYAVTEYGISFASILGHNHLFATQFHLEKSGPPGLKILDNFCKWHPLA